MKYIKQSLLSQFCRNKVMSYLYEDASWYVSTGFTLVELIVVITILIILGLISFLSFTGYASNARDSTRISDITNISKGLEMYQAKVGIFPIPDDNKFNITTSGGVVIGQQGYAGDNTMRLIKLSANSGKDPLANEYYSYSRNNSGLRYQLQGFLENGDSKDYKKEIRNKITKGNGIGIFLVGGIDTNYIPLQEVFTGDLDVVNNTGSYTVVLGSSDTPIVGSGSAISSTIIGNYVPGSPIQTQNEQTLIKTFGGKGGDYITSCLADNIGNMYVGAYYENDNINTKLTTDFDGNTLLGKTGIVSYTALVTKLDSSGNRIWMKSLGGKGYTNLANVSIDTTGNVYVGGYFTNNSANTNSVTDFAGNTIFGKTTSIANTIFVAKLDSSGNQVWIKTFGGNGGDLFSSLSIDTSGNIYVGGTYNNSSSNGYLVTDFAGNTLLGKYNGDGFIAKLDNSGNQIWVKTMGGMLEDRITSLSIDTSGNIYAGGFYRNKNTNNRTVTDFAGNALPGKSSSETFFDSFVVKIDNSGNQVWIKSMGGFYSDYVSKVFVDTDGNVYVGGIYSNDTSNGSSVTDFAGNTLLGKTSNHSENSLLAKLDNSGTQVWIKTLGSIFANAIWVVSTDTDGNIYVGGKFNNNNTSTGTTDFAGAPLFTKFTSFVEVLYLAKLDNSGTQVWIKTLGGLLQDLFSSVFVDTNKNIFTCGGYGNDAIDTYSVTDFIGNKLLGNPSDGFFQIISQ